MTSTRGLLYRFSKMAQSLSDSPFLIASRITLSSRLLKPIHPNALLK